MKSSRLITLSVIALLVFPLLIQAQTWNDVIEETRGDTAVVIPGFGTLNDAVDGDTLVTGQRANENRVYELKRGQYYFLSGWLMAPEFDLTIVGQKDDPALSTFPAIVCSGTSEDNWIAANNFFVCGQNLTLKDFATVNKSDQGVNGVRHVRMSGDSNRVILDNMYMTYGRWICVDLTESTWPKVHCTNTTFKNQHSKLHNGRAFNWDAANKGIDSFYVENTTYLNVNGSSNNLNANTVNYLWFNHNTLVNGMQRPMNHDQHVNSYITNNIWYNVNLYGDSEFQIAQQNDSDFLPFGTVSLDTMRMESYLENYDPPADGDFYADAEADRKVLVHNNLYYHSPIFSDLLSGWTQEGLGWVEAPWMNSRTEAMFADDATWPHLVHGTLYEEEINFASEGTDKDLMVQYLTDIYGGAQEGADWMWDPDGDPVLITWPVEEDLSYDNTNLLTAAFGGVPLGDLNWFPVEKAAWQAMKDDEMNAFVSWVQAGEIQTKVESHNKVVDGFELIQNYPNPFNPETNIMFKLDKPSNVTLAIYNMLGQQVSTLVDQNMAAGKHEVKWNGTNSVGNQVVSGIYFCKLQLGDRSQTIKMLLTK